eukprot:TRINITY_DN627_c0_g1_i1.p1 TRINITY_DN627_c0_g1~~TRINITY_DN627_c0_g1_i1.p1  ORF type:complete len:185 (+),score=67.33 TRINITY_DN627_c0_g1_i1:152-706(+)
MTSEHKLVIVGGGGVGKSCLTVQFIKHQFVDEYDPTIEETYRKQVFVDDIVCVLDILDTAGQEEYNAMRDQYMRAGHGFIVVYSVIDNNSFEAIPELMEHIIQTKDSSKIPKILVANKCDFGAPERKITAEQGKQLADKYGCPYLECSAKSRLNVDEAFFGLVREIRKAGDAPAKKKKKGCQIL